MPNGLVPQAPVHTDSLTEYRTDLKIIHTEEGEGAELRHPIVVAQHVVEQRVSHFLMGLALFGTMSGPLLVVLGLFPRALFAGVFLVVGVSALHISGLTVQWGSIETNGILQKFLFLLKEPRFIPQNEPLNGLPRRKIVFYVALQMVGVLVCVAISQTIAAIGMIIFKDCANGIGFPILICALIPFRWVIVPKWFTTHELDVMDAATADNPIVLASLGGPPRSSGGMGIEGGGLERRYSQHEHGVERQRAGSIHR
jgi:hypothetical protein